MKIVTAYRRILHMLFRFSIAVVRASWPSRKAEREREILPFSSSPHKRNYPLSKKNAHTYDTLLHYKNTLTKHTQTNTQKHQPPSAQRST